MAATPTRHSSRQTRVSLRIHPRVASQRANTVLRRAELEAPARGEARSLGEQEGGLAGQRLRGGREEAQRLGEGQLRRGEPRGEGEGHSDSSAH